MFEYFYRLGSKTQERCIHVQKIPVPGMMYGVCFSAALRLEKMVKMGASVATQPKKL